jgi:hypothetical protein
MYQELVLVTSVAAAIASWCSIHRSSASLRLADLQVVVAHIPDAVADPIGLLLQAGGHVAQRCRRRERRGGREQVQIAVHLQPDRGANLPGPILFQQPSAAATDVDPRQRAGSGVEAGGEDQPVKGVLRAICKLQPVRRDAFDPIVPDADDLDEVCGRRLANHSNFDL